MGGFVPALDRTAERVQLFEREHAALVIDALERGAELAELAPELPDLDLVQQELDALRATILGGSRVPRREEDGPEPAMHMPPWDERMHAEGGPRSRAEVDALIAYLLSLQPR